MYSYTFLSPKILLQVQFARIYSFYAVALPRSSLKFITTVPLSMSVVSITLPLSVPSKLLSSMRLLGAIMKWCCCGFPYSSRFSFTRQVTAISITSGQLLLRTEGTFNLPPFPLPLPAEVAYHDPKTHREYFACDNQYYRKLNCKTEKYF